MLRGPRIPRLLGHMVAAPRLVRHAKSDSTSIKKPSKKSTVRDAKPRTTKLKLANETSKPPNVNEVNIPLLNPDVHQQIFGPNVKSSSANKAKITKASSVNKDKNSRIDISIEHLRKQDIWGKSADPVPDVSLELPQMRGSTISEHFYNIGREESEPYLTIAKKFSELPLQKPPDRDSWVMEEGWRKYEPDGTCTKVNYPDEDMLTFDVEVLITDKEPDTDVKNPYPLLACAASPTAWYGWVSPRLIDPNMPREQLIPMGPKKRIIVGHNIGYDRARILEEYDSVRTDSRFLDTMSLHVAVAGLCSQQRPEWMLKHKTRLIDQINAALPKEVVTDSENLLPEVLLDKGEIIEDLDDFYDVSTLNSLKQVVEFYCDGHQLDKDQRDWFVKGTLKDIKENFKDMMNYCAEDVYWTHKVYQVVFPRFLVNCPHPVSFAGMLGMGNTFLTVNERWEEYLRKAEQTNTELENEVDRSLRLLAEEALKLHTAGDDTLTKDDWLSQLDWSLLKRPKTTPPLPKWYRDNYDKETGEFKISVRNRAAPLLLKLRWLGYPLHFVQPLKDENKKIIKTFGWCFKVPKEKAAVEFPKLTAAADDDGYVYFKLPHKDGDDAACGNPIAKGYIPYFEEGKLVSEYTAASRALDLNAKSAYWISARERIKSQLVVWDNQDNGPRANVVLGAKSSETKSVAKKHGIILPQLIPMGTITRRAVEKTWLTASNAKKNRIGSELKAMVQAPPGFKIVGADVDSEELWIAGVIGDSQFGFHGATALGWMTLQGTKSAGTDLHSKTANILHVDRDKAKIFNYARIYGAGVTYAARVLKQHNPELSTDEAKELAEKLYIATKGGKGFAKSTSTAPTWRGGSESYMFNALEYIAFADQPRTPVLGCTITDALKKKYIQKRFIPSRINWVVQSSGVDYLHLLIVSMEHLIRRYKLNARFMISVHDEVRYLSSEKDQYHTALALQVANLWTRAMFSHRLGIENLPQSVAYFSAVDLDDYFRKETYMECITPSNDVPLGPGESLTMLQLLEKVKGFDSAGVQTEQLIPEVDEKEYDELIKALGPPLSPSPPESLKTQNLDPPMRRPPGSSNGSSSSSSLVFMDESSMQYL